MSRLARRVGVAMATFAFAAAAAARDLDRRLAHVVARDPARLARVELGVDSTSPLEAIVLADARGDAAPVLLVCPDPAIDPEEGERAVLELAAKLAAASRAAPRPTPRAGSAWIFLPRLHAGEAVAEERGFPTEWDGWDPRAGGAYPLARPESRGLAEYLVEAESLSRVVLVGAEGERRPAAPGSFELFLTRGLGLAVVRIDVGPDAPRRIAQEAALDARLELLELERERLSRDVWRVDFLLRNSGATGTRRSGASPSEGPELVPPGGELTPELFAGTWIALAEDRGQGFVLRARGTRLAPLAPGEECRVRWIVAPAARGELELRVGSPRAAPAECTLDLLKGTSVTGAGGR